MNRGAMFTLRAVPLAACLSFALLAGCGSSGPPAGEPPLAGAAIGGPFELVDSDGQTVRWSDFDGKFRVVYFGYAYCPDICPLDVQRMMQGFAQFKQANPELSAQVRPIFITVDPARDTPAVVGEFTRAFSNDLIGLTGTPEQVDQAAKAFAVYYQKGEVGAGGGYMMDHSRAAFLMGRNGEPIATLPVDKSAEAVAAELAKWVS
jgi:protein SCO1/2